MDLPFRPPKRSRRSSEYETSQLITAERRVGSRRKLRVSSLPVRIGESLLFLVSCLATAVLVGFVAYVIDGTAPPSGEEGANIWQAFESLVARFAFSVVGMWLVHLATSLIVNRIRRARASEARRAAILAGAIAYPLFFAMVAVVGALDMPKPAATVITLIIPAVVATLMAPRVLPRSSAPV